MSNQNFSSKSSAKGTKKPDGRAVDPTETSGNEVQVKATGRWTREEHYRFLEALKIYGKEWKKVQ